MLIDSLSKLHHIEFEKIKESNFWNTQIEQERKIHKIHIYPARFPSLIAQKAFQYLESRRINIHRVVDIFCGCGTVAVESKRKGYDFWGCDINPVAVLISKVKTNSYNIELIKKLYNDIIFFVNKNKSKENFYLYANERLKYWYTENQYNELFIIKQAIENCIEEGKYKDLFLCIFSSILKATSKWLWSAPDF